MLLKPAVKMATSSSPIAVVIAPDFSPDRALLAFLRSVGFEPIVVRRIAEGLRKIESGSPALILLDIDIPEAREAFVRRIREQDLTTPIVLLTGAEQKTAWSEVWDRGRTYVVPKGAGLDLLGHTLVAQGIVTHRNIHQDHDLEVFQHSAPMRAIETLVREAAAVDAAVLIEGEPGVGKELVARAIHRQSRRATGPLMRLNCRSLPPDLLECELLGVVRVQPSADLAHTPGRLELAGGGSLLLDEVGELSLKLQSSLRMILEEHRFFAVGGRRPLKANARIIAATSRSLGSLVASGQFQSALFHRLRSLTIAVPPLRERAEEIPFLIEHFRTKFERQFERNTPALSRQTIDLMSTYRWPGNVRELENLIKRYVVLGDEALLRNELRARMAVKGAPAATLKRSRGIGRIPN